jgi:hypothetical protein
LFVDDAKKGRSEKYELLLPRQLTKGGRRRDRRWVDITEEEMADVFLPELRRWAEREDRWVDGERSPEPPHRSSLSAHLLSSGRKTSAISSSVISPYLAMLSS